jgi:hypothetical protein
MLAPLETPAVEHLTPHDLVTYFRCPHEMELVHALHLQRRTGNIGPVRTPLDVLPLRQSPLFSPPLSQISVNEGRLDLFDDGDRLVYEDTGEENLPMLFPPDRVTIDSKFSNGHTTLVDSEWGFAGRPDLVVRRADGQLFPVEYKQTHLFGGYHQVHGRLFDTIQVVAECRLVEATFGSRPGYGVVLYGDESGGGVNEGWVQIPYADAEARWLKVAIDQIRQDRTRAPVPSLRTCGSCEPNEEGLCRFATARYEGPHHHQRFLAAPRP